MLLYAFRDEAGHWHGDPATPTLDGDPGTGTLLYRPDPAAGPPGPFAGQRLDVLYGPCDLDVGGPALQLDDGTAVTATWRVLELLDGGPERPPTACGPAATPGGAPVRYQVTTADRHYTLTVHGTAVHASACTHDGEARSELTGTLEPGDLGPIVQLLSAAALPAQPYRAPHLPSARPAPPPRRPAGSEWTAHEEQVCRARAGATPQELATELGRSVKSVRWKLYQFGLADFPEELVAVPGQGRPAKEPAYRVEDVRQDHAQAYRRWSPEDDERLRLMAATGAMLPELVAAFGRQEGGILSRLRKIGATGPVVDQVDQAPPPPGAP